MEKRCRETPRNATPDESPTPTQDLVIAALLAGKTITADTRAGARQGRRESGARNRQGVGHPGPQLYWEWRRIGTRRECRAGEGSGRGGSGTSGTSDA